MFFAMGKRFQPIIPKCHLYPEEPVFHHSSVRYSVTMNNSGSQLHIALIEPEIPPNTGNIARLCAATYTPLHLVGKLGFRIDDKAVQRAGLDYWDEVEIHRHLNIEALYEALRECRFLYLSTKGERLYTDFVYQPNDCLVFGRETRGLPEDLLRANWERCLTIPMPNKNVRSLNLATSVAIVLYEALRQIRKF